MKYGICNISSIPIRKEPAESSEMRTELLFGEHFKILELTERWAKIKLAFDGYEGWIDRKIIQALTESEFESINNSSCFITNQQINKVQNLTNNIEFLIGGGSSLPNFDAKTKSFNLGEEKYKLLSEFFKTDKSDLRKGIIDFATKYINCSYLWGGRNPFGIDCSGLSQISYKVFGINILRDASQQVTHGKIIEFIDDAKPADLAFFDNADGLITHVGLILDKNHIIHSSGKVRIDKIDHQGIFNEERQIYTHKLRIIKNIID
ncbi:MAG: hypothetical protein A2046_16210 [Bacteroidetes bacterium GWA2_30_7]|nr:MAG: hypothetical protein A2046_16210 [Bacteroidetes bacterium GWA2_30_7]